MNAFKTLASLALLIFTRLALVQAAIYVSSCVRIAPEDVLTFTRTGNRPCSINCLPWWPVLQRSVG